MEVKDRLKDTWQIRRMKKQALLPQILCSGEIYKLLSLKELHELVKKIDKGNIKLISNIVYKKGYISYEEHFILLLDKYIGYVRDNYLISHSELVFILKETLKNKYTKCLLSKKFFHDNYDYYLYNFKLMFLYNFINNIEYFSKLYIDSNSIKKISKYIDITKLKDNEYLNSIEKLIKEIVNNRKNNLYTCFIYNQDMDKKRNDYYFYQIDWVLEDYYKKRQKLTNKYDNITNQKRGII